MKKYLPHFQIFLLIIVAVPIFKDYIHFNFSSILCLLLSPIAFHIRYPQVYSGRYFFAAIICFILFFILNMKVFFLLAVGMSVFFIIESQIGKITEIPLLLLTIFSPTLSYLSSIFTFPIKLELSKWAANSLNIIGLSVKQTGNYFEWGNASFSVDTACVGLNLLITSFALTLLWIAFSEIKYKKRISLLNILLLVIISFIFVIIANYSRIILLVIFKSMPETLGHELIGLMSLGLYVCLPMYFLVQISYKKFAIFYSDLSNSKKAIYQNKQKYLTIILFFFAMFFSFSFKHIENTDKSLLSLQKDGFNKEIMTENIVKFSNDTTIIYLKPAAKFWGCDHSPLICWQASGYQFEKIQEKNFGGTKVYVAELQSTNNSLPKLYTAWWYDNGKEKTISQSYWRWQMMRGKAPFQMINVSTFSEKELAQACKIWF